VTLTGILCGVPAMHEPFVGSLMRGTFAMLSLFLFFSFPFHVSPAGAAAAGPMELVKQTVEEARSVFKDDRLSQDARIEKLKGIAEERFDFEEMSKRALAIQWRKLTPDQRREFVSLFSKLVEDTYSTKIRRYEEEIKREAEDKILYTGEHIDGPHATVRTKIITTKGAEVPVDYRFINKGGNWRVYDVIVEGVSFLNNYRSQFNEIMHNGSYAELVGRLKDKVSSVR
jgi:phospholipid transport system substrate-binding protein